MGTSTTITGFQITEPVQSYQASGDLSASQYCAVTYNSSQQVLLPSANGSILGILQNNPNAAGKAAEVQSGNVSKAKFGGTVTAADIVKVDSSGRFVTANASDIALGYGVGQCIVGGGTNQIGCINLDVKGSNLVAVTGDETVTSGALSANALTSYISATGTQTYTLPNGVYNGQKKRIECSVAATTPIGTLTITTPFTSEQATYVFQAVGQAIELEWRAATGWHLTKKQRAGRNTYVVGTNNVGAGDLFQNVDLSVTATVASSLANGNYTGETIHITVSTAASTPSGSITGAFRKKDGGTAATWGSGTVINATTAFTWLMWDQADARWHEINTATATYA